MSPRSITASPDTMIKAKAGLLWAALVAVVSCTVVCTAYVVRMDAKIDAALSAIRSVDERTEAIAPQHAILWDWYGRTAARLMPPKANP
jgi:hypothetical protein